MPNKTSACKGFFTFLCNQIFTGFQHLRAYNPLSRPNYSTTSQAQAQLVYTVNQPNPQLWDSEFQAAVVATLAAQLVPALALNMNLMKMQIAIADKIITEARVRDANEGSNTQDHIPYWIRARNSGNGYYNNGFNANGYTDIVWGF